VNGALGDEDWMRLAIEEAGRALAKGEVPVGSVIVRNGELVGRGHNLRETAQDPTAHAELIAMRAASGRLGTFRLSDATCYVTLEPCPMCAGALVNARIGRLVYGAVDPKAGAIVTLYNLHDDARLNHRYPAQGGVLGPECGALLTEFFGAVRRKKREGLVR
jgi:tRNA(adenine34) deaminase